ncbi:NB-ARC domain-containing protein [Streptomyces brasiliscabiei]|uniref:NB-ARC domain-containing protein n=1 Tax=Streptomyces brasiliscabiei TaxID=2736302 RepID=A0ABU8GT05_9ACTN
MKAEVKYPGSVRMEFRRRLGNDWEDLADLLEIEPHVSRSFTKGREAGEIWDLLLSRGTLGELPEVLRRINREDLAHVFEEHAGDASATSPEYQSQVPGLPSHYVEREELITALRERLLAPGPDHPSGAPLVMITGMAGVGKSVTARALARDPSVVAHFTDGVVWLELGKSRNIQTAQNELMQALGGVVGTSVDQRQVNARLNNLVRGKSLLLVLDDAWEPEQLRAFEIHHPTVTILVTTRDRELLHTGNSEQAVDALDERSARHLFARHLEIVPEELSEDELGIVQECAGLPLALAVTGAGVAGRRPHAATLLHRLRAGKVDQIDIRLLHYPYPSLLTALDASVVELSPAQKACYLSLAVFKDVGSVPFTAFDHLWESRGLSRYDVQDMLISLDRRSLLTLDWDNERVTVHGLLFDYIALHVDPADLLRYHRELAHSYLDRWGGLDGDLRKLRAAPELDEGQHYGIARVVFHLAEGGCVEEMHALLALSVPPSGVAKNGANLWYTFRNGLHQGAGYLEDIKIAWDAASVGSVPPGIDTGPGPDASSVEPSVALPLRYGLVTASLRSIAAQISPRLLARMADTGAWPGDRCLHHALRMPQDEARTEALATFLPHLAAPDVDSVLAEIVSGLPRVRKQRRAEILSHVTARLSPGQVAVVLDMLEEMRAPQQFADVIEVLLPRLTEAQARKALETAAGLPLKPHRAWAQTLLATVLPAPERVDLQLRCLFENAFDGTAHHCEAVGGSIRAALGGAVDEERVVDVFRLMSADAPQESVIAMACAALPLLSGSRRRTVLDQACAPANGAAAAHASLVDATRAAFAAVPSPERRTNALVTAAAVTGDSAVLEEALEASIAAAKRPGSELPAVFLQLCPHLPDELLDRALTEAPTINKKYRAKAFAALAPWLPADRLHTFLRLAGKNKWWAREVLPAVFEFLTQELRSEAVSVIAAVEPADERAELLQLVAPHMDPSSAELALPLAQALEDRSVRFATLAAVAARTLPAVRHAAMDDTLTEFLESGAPGKQRDAWDLLGENLDRRQLQRMSSRMAELGDSHLAVSAITSFTPFASPEERRSLIRAATELARQVPDAELRVRALVGLARRLPRKHRGELVAEALKALGKVFSPEQRGDLAFAVLSAAPVSGGSATLRSALSVLPKTGSQAASPLLSLARREGFVAPDLEDLELTAHAEQEGGAASSSTPTHTAMFNAMFKGSDHPRKKLAFALATGEEGVRAEGLITVARHLPPSLHEEAITAARLLQSMAIRAKALRGIAPAMGPARANALLAEAWDIRLSAEDRSSGLRVAAAFLPLAPRRARLPAGHCLLQEAEAVEGSLARCRALISLAEVLPTPLTGLAIPIARRIVHPSMRAAAIAEICKRLPARVAHRTAAEVVGAIVQGPDPAEAAQALASASAVLADEDRTRLGLQIIRTASALDSDALKSAVYRELTRVDSESVGSALLKESKKLAAPDRAAVMAGLAKYCDASQHAFALSHLDDLADTRARGHAAESLIPYHDDRTGYFDVIAGLGDAPYVQARLLGALAAHGSADITSRAMEAAYAMPKIAPKISAVMSIAPHLYEESRIMQIEQDFLKRCTKERNNGEMASAFVELSRFAQGPDRERIIVDALVECLSVASPRRRADLALSMGRTLAGLRQEDKAETLDRCLRAATARGRYETVSCLPLLVPLMLSLEAEGIVTEGSRAVRDVFRWWP